MFALGKLKLFLLFYSILDIDMIFSELGTSVEWRGIQILTISVFNRLPFLRHSGVV